MKRKTKLKKNVRNIFIILFFSFFMFIGIGIGSALSKVTALNKEKIELEEKLSSTKLERKYLENEIERLKDEEYVARYAREKYLFSKEGEYIIKIQK